MFPFYKAESLIAVTFHVCKCLWLDATACLRNIRSQVGAAIIMLQEVSKWLFADQLEGFHIVTDSVSQCAVCIPCAMVAQIRRELVKPLYVLVLVESTLVVSAYPPNSWRPTVLDYQQFLFELATSIRDFQNAFKVNHIIIGIDAQITLPKRVKGVTGDITTADWFTDQKQLDLQNSLLDFVHQFHLFAANTFAFDNAWEHNPNTILRYRYKTEAQIDYILCTDGFSASFGNIKNGTIRSDHNPVAVRLSIQDFVSETPTSGADWSAGSPAIDLAMLGTLGSNYLGGGKPFFRGVCGLVWGGEIPLGRTTPE